jgi:hypothetical protein
LSAASRHVQHCSTARINGLEIGAARREQPYHTVFRGEHFGAAR